MQILPIATILALLLLAAGLVTDASGRAISATTPAKQRSDRLMRECGTEWRTNRAQLKAQGKRWRGFLAECRVRKKI